MPMGAHLNEKQRVYVTCWALSDEEIERIVATKRLWLCVFGQAHPPVFITGFEEMVPFKREGETQ